jgi:tetratricopeptide (TPR) repeat protein
VKKIIQNTKYFILDTLIFLLPLFFLNTTQEFFATNKLYLLGFGILLLLLISTIQLIFLKKISWQKDTFDGPIILFLTSVAVSTFFTPNKVQSLLNLNFGLAMMVFLTILYFYVSRNCDEKGDHKGSPLQILSLISALLSAITIILYFQPFKNIAPPGFSPVGSRLDLAILLGFFVIWAIVSFPRRRESSDSGSLIRSGMMLIINLLALFLTVYSLIKPNSGLILPSFRLSWFAALEILKNPLTAITGVGPDNFSTVFTKIKDFSYNQSPFWQINSFYVSRSAFLQIITETGISGLLSFCVLIFYTIKQLIRVGHDRPLQLFLLIYLIICLFVLPSSLIIWFLFFTVLGLTLPTGRQVNQATTKLTIDLTDFLPVYLGIIIISLSLIGGFGYLLGRSYTSEYFYKKSLDGVTKNNVEQAYENQRQAIILNPYIERYRNSFAQINIFIANNLAKKELKKISEKERQTITQAVQMAISEGKQLIKLNPKKAQYWANLGDIYMNIISLAKDSDIWAIASYQRAIALDPFNPVYQLNIGGVYYRIGRYREAIPFFEEATKLKPDWSNSHYNLAWAYFRNKEYQKAVLSMQNSVNLINKNKFPKEWETANRDFELFKNEYDKSNDSPK